MSSAYYPLAFCEAGGHIVRANLMISADCCFDCAPEKKEGGDQSRRNKTLGNMESGRKGATADPISLGKANYLKAEDDHRN